MTKLVLIDGNAVLHRAYHAMPPLNSNDGTPINAVYGFVSMLLRIIIDLKPTHIVVAWDTAKPTFRHTEYSAYQAQRPKGDSELIVQFDIAYKVLDAMQIPKYFLEGFEADDVIGTLATQVTESKRVKEQESKSVDEINIITGDRDILQLVDDDKHIFVYMPTKGISEGKLYKDSDVVERMGVHANQIIDFKALVGDQSDNYPGVSGIGPKTAIDLLKTYGTLEQIYKNLNDIKPATAKKLAEGAEPAGISQRLATIVKDVPLTFKLEEAKKWDISSKKVLDLFSQIGFRTLSERVTKVGAEIAKSKQMNLV